MISVSYLVSYDYAMLLTSIKQLYDDVDKIVLAIDSESKTWSGNTFKIPDSFFDEVKIFDKKDKIQFYFDQFYMSDLTPMECESRERNMVLKKLGKGWKIQLDVDEYIYDFKKITKYLNKYWYLNLFPKLTPICFQGNLITLFRELPDGYLYIDNEEKFPFITNQTINTHTRGNNKIKNHFSNIKVIHQSWARSEEQVHLKIKNWGHRDDFDTEIYFQFWKGLNSSNYKEFKDIHPITPKVWNVLEFMPSNSIDDFIAKFEINNGQIPLLLSNKMVFKAGLKRLIRLK
ncbi:hypothetical protein NLG42_01475 [Flavobacterium plurextorum]|uniref:hypothetical protein n=1 Tax=Flavobacterium TaxID=237 RepID=UPI00214D9085|nr:MULTISPECIES: hypothetical protein [Flavobacterium]UUW09481.1 hypothetical protein NLG42_01475 [Flavobacterium plurextorum]